MLADTMIPEARRKARLSGGVVLALEASPPLPASPGSADERA